MSLESERCSQDRCFCASLHCSKPHAPDQRTSRINHSPVPRKSASHRRVYRIHPRFRGDSAGSRAGVFDQEVHCRNGEARFTDRLEVLRRGALLRPPPTRSHHHGPNDDLAIRLFCQQQKTRLCCDLQERQPLWRVQNAFGTWAAETPNPGQRAEEQNLVRCHLFDGSINSIFGRPPGAATALMGSKCFRRSEEHTSELQSPCNLVCRLLLEKKKQKKIT